LKLRRKKKRRLRKKKRKRKKRNNCKVSGIKPFRKLKIVVQNKIVIFKTYVHRKPIRVS
jgi:hypothetical protein